MTYNKLIAGFDNFKKNYFQSEKREEYQKLVKEGQKPDTLIIACSDSRIDPAILTHCDPGEFFAVRNVAALVPPYNNGGLLRGTSSAIEYAVRCLNVEHIIVLGHSGCGGIHALATENFHVNEDDNFEFLHHWLHIGLDAKEYIDKTCSHKSDDEKITLLEQAAIVTSLENLLTFPWIKTKHDLGDIKIHGWYFDMEQGQLLEYNKNDDVFQNLTQDKKE